MRFMTHFCDKWVFIKQAVWNKRLVRGLSEMLEFSVFLWRMAEEKSVKIPLFRDAPIFLCKQSGNRLQQRAFAI